MKRPAVQAAKTSLERSSALKRPAKAIVEQAECNVFRIPAGFQLQCGEELDGRAFLAYQTYGRLNETQSNAILFTTCYGERSIDSSVTKLIGPGKRFDSSRYFLITVNMLGNGLSFSPTTPGSKWPHGGISYHDNVRAQRLLLDCLGVERLALIYGFSMGAMLALEWAVQFPKQVSSVVAVCGSAKTVPANVYFLEALQDALRSDPLAELADSKVITGFGGVAQPACMDSYAAIYADWIFDAPMASGGGSADASRPEYARSRPGGRAYAEKLYAERFGVDTLEYFLRVWRADFANWDAMEHYAVSSTWLRGDVSNNSTHKGDLRSALASIEALVYIMPGSSDQYFIADDIKDQAALIPNCVYEPLVSPMGHAAERMPDMQPQIDAAIAACLAKAAAETG